MKRIENTRQEFPNNQCVYCKRVFKEIWDIPSVDHVVAKNLMGEDNTFNRVVCCYRCNQFKGNRNLGQFRRDVKNSDMFTSIEKEIVVASITELIPLIQNDLNKIMKWLDSETGQPISRRVKFDDEDRKKFLLCLEDWWN